MPVSVLASEPVATRRRVFFQLVGTDGITPATGEAGGQPQVSTDGAAWTDTGVGVLSAVGNGRYYADLTTGAVASSGARIETRYKSSSTAECPGDTVSVVAFDPYALASGPGGGGSGGGSSVYWLLTVTDDDGTIVTGATVTIASVTDPDGAAIASHGAVLHIDGANVSAEYDAATKGKAWVTLSVSKSGSVFSGLNASPRFGLSVPAFTGGAVASVTAPVDINLSQSITDVQTATVGGAMAGSWATAWGRVTKNLSTRILKLWGPGNTTGTPSTTFMLDNATNPTSKTPQ